MPLPFQPKEKSVLVCDFNGFVIPEMVKVRPVIVIARNRLNSQLVTIVPLSTTEPDPISRYHHEFAVNPLPDKRLVRSWAKCDMVTTVSLARLDRYKFRVQGMGRKYVVPTIEDEDFEAVRRAVLAALRLSSTLGDVL